MTERDEPLFESDAPPGESADAPPSVRERVASLVNEQPYAVLCMQGQEQPYGALVAVAFSEDLRYAVFATPVTTRKYRLLSSSNRVAVVVDSRSSHSDDVMAIEAVTATGRSRRVDRGPDARRWKALLLQRHPYLDTFVEASSCALFCIEIVRYFHVVRFQEVNQWSPKRDS